MLQPTSGFKETAFFNFYFFKYTLVLMNTNFVRKILLSIIGSITYHWLVSVSYKSLVCLFFSTLSPAESYCGCQWLA